MSRDPKLSLSNRQRTLLVVFSVMLILGFIAWRTAFVYETSLADRGFHSQPAIAAIYSLPFLLSALLVLTVFNGTVFLLRGHTGLSEIRPVVFAVCLLLAALAAGAVIGTYDYNFYFFWDNTVSSYADS